MSHSPFAEITLSCWADIHQYGRPGWIYRGQKNATWSLKTSLERCFGRHNIPQDRAFEVESELLREFRRAYHHYSCHVPAPTDVVEWLSLMQHHGAPTRLLDFTYSIYIACYFALEMADDDAAIWAVDGIWAIDESARTLRAHGKPADDVEALRRRFIEGSEAVMDSLIFARPFVAMACPLNPFRLNERLRIQKGVFLTPGSVELTFLDNLAALAGHDSHDKVLKIVVPKHFAADALTQLFQMNISRATLFPGLDGYAQALGVLHPSFQRGGMLWYTSKSPLASP